MDLAALRGLLAGLGLLLDLVLLCLAFLRRSRCLYAVIASILLRGQNNAPPGWDGAPRHRTRAAGLVPSRELTASRALAILACVRLRPFAIDLLLFAPPGRACPPGPRPGRSAAAARADDVEALHRAAEARPSDAQALAAYGRALIARDTVEDRIRAQAVLKRAVGARRRKTSTSPRAGRPVHPAGLPHAGAPPAARPRCKHRLGAARRTCGWAGSRCATGSSSSAGARSTRRAATGRTRRGGRRPNPNRGSGWACSRCSTATPRGAVAAGREVRLAARRARSQRGEALSCSRAPARTAWAGAAIADSAFRAALPLLAAGARPLLDITPAASDADTAALRRPARLGRAERFLADVLEEPRSRPDDAAQRAAARVPGPRRARLLPVLRREAPRVGRARPLLSCATARPTRPTTTRRARRRVRRPSPADDEPPDLALPRARLRRPARGAVPERALRRAVVAGRWRSTSCRDAGLARRAHRPRASWPRPGAASSAPCCRVRSGSGRGARSALFRRVAGLRPAHARRRPASSPPGAAAARAARGLRSRCAGGSATRTCCRRRGGRLRGLDVRARWRGRARDRFAWCLSERCRSRSSTSTCRRATTWSASRRATRMRRRPGRGACRCTVPPPLPGPDRAVGPRARLRARAGPGAATPFAQDRRLGRAQSAGAACRATSRSASTSRSTTW